MKITPEQVAQLQAPLPAWAVKQHPTKPTMSAIHPMSIIDRLNEVFGMGGWQFGATHLSCEKEIQKTRNGPRDVYVSAVHGSLDIPEYNIHIEQFGGSTNDDKGDALKGGGTDALTKIASYLGIGAEIYKGQGNNAPKSAVPNKPHYPTAEEEGIDPEYTPFGEGSKPLSVDPMGL